MKNILFAILFGTALTVNAQITEEAKISTLPGLAQSNPSIEKNNYEVPMYTTVCTMQLKVLPQTKEIYPFKIYQIDGATINTQQDMYNAIRSAVPSVSITNTNLNQTPIISMRGDSNTIVIVDGVRYDASILNLLNPSDIENIKVVNDVAGSNYFLNGRY
jgi:outer membrane receptor for ferrienterochelin and colicin